MAFFTVSIQRSVRIVFVSRQFSSLPARSWCHEHAPFTRPGCGWASGPYVDVRQDEGGTVCAGTLPLMVIAPIGGRWRYFARPTGFRGKWATQMRR